MTVRHARLLFLGGTGISLALFLVLTVDTHRQVAALTHADRLSDEVVRGKKVFESRNCNDCHTILGFGGYYAPDLTRAYGRLGEDALRFRLTRPEEAFAASTRKMPNPHLTPSETSDLVAFLRWVDGIENNDWPPQDSKKRHSSGVQRLVATGMSHGAALVKEKGCLGCHSIKGVGGTSAPALDSETDFQFVCDYIKNPKAFYPDSRMPPRPDLTEDERADIARFLTGK